MTDDIAAMRVSYDQDQLLESDLADTPLEQFARWLAHAAAHPAIPEPNAMVLGTGEQTPSTRTVLLKSIDGRGLTFYTNYRSRKAADIVRTPSVTALFPWYPLHRQVAVMGTASKVSREESAEYFASRPHGSKLGALASAQSTVLASRDALESKMEQLQEQYPEGSDVPLPDNWGGYLIAVHSIEFWQGRVSRLHDRLRFESVDESGRLDNAADWTVRRYSP